IIGKTDQDLLNPHLASHIIANDQKVLQSGTSQEFEEQVQLPDGIRTYLSVKFPLFDAAGTPYAICGIATDITARKQAER
ncbi:MAG: PAS domain-containing protein, partial [Nitrospira sp.]|nr:PAS domain-containing protein [Nitrospira sp.]